jgi:hypothetical protein
MRNPLRGVKSRAAGARPADRLDRSCDAANAVNGEEDHAPAAISERPLRPPVSAQNAAVIRPVTNPNDMPSAAARARRGSSRRIDHPHASGGQTADDLIFETAGFL